MEIHYIKRNRLHYQLTELHDVNVITLCYWKYPNGIVLMEICYNNVFALHYWKFTLTELCYLKYSNGITLLQWNCINRNMLH